MGWRSHSGRIVEKRQEKLEAHVSLKALLVMSVRKTIHLGP